jgi:clan AA aspartic protease (TIGR02281 family)
MGTLAQIRRLFAAPALLPLTILLLVALAIASGQAFAVEPFPDNCKLVRQAGLPFLPARGHIAVAVTVNGQPLHFIVDTGGFYSTITPAMVEQLGLHPANIRDDIKISDAGGAQARKFARIDDLVIGTTRARGVTLMIGNGGRGEDGALAPEMLRNFDLDFDMGARTLNLFKPHPCSDHAVYWTDDYSAVPFDITDQGHIRFAVTLNGVAMRAILDTGAPATLIGDEIAAPLHSQDTSDGAMALAGGSGGALQGSPRLFDDLVIGKFQFPQPTLLVTSKDSTWKSDGGQILLGLNIMQGLHFYIDYKRKVLYLSRS